MYQHKNIYITKQKQQVFLHNVLSQLHGKIKLYVWYVSQLDNMEKSEVLMS